MFGMLLEQRATIVDVGVICQDGVQAQMTTRTTTTRVGSAMG